MVNFLADLWTLEQVASVCDHTYLSRPESFKGDSAGAIAAYRADLRRFVSETVALPFQPYALCVRPEEVEFVVRTLEENLSISPVICSVVGFPDGGTPTTAKVADARVALAAGAREIDMVLDYRAYAAGHSESAENDARAVIDVVHAAGAKLKLILEVSELPLEQIGAACRDADRWGVDMVKTSTGFSREGATVEALTVIATHFPRGIKISGGVRSNNLTSLLDAVARGRGSAVPCDPAHIRIGESGLLKELKV